MTIGTTFYSRSNSSLSMKAWKNKKFDNNKIKEGKKQIKVDKILENHWAFILFFLLFFNKRVSYQDY